MDPNQYGPFATTIAVAAALAASCSLLLVKSVGRLPKWAWLGGDVPQPLLTTAVKAPAFVLIAVTFISINKDNYPAFLALSAVSAAIVACLAFRLHHHRILHVVFVPETASDGSHMRDADGKPVYRPVVIGAEADMLPAAANAYAAAKAKNASLTLSRFVSGFGTPYDPESIWSPETLAAVRDRLCLFAMGIILAAVMSLYLSASAVEASMRPGVPDTASPPQSATAP